MKNKSEKNLDSLFQKAKDISTELPMKKMEKMILSFPDHPISVPESNWFAKLFNLKYIAMTIIPFIAILTFWMVPDQPVSTATFTEIGVEQTSTSISTLPDDPTETPPENLTQIQVKTATTTLPKSIAKTNTDLPNTYSKPQENLLPIIKPISTDSIFEPSEEKELIYPHPPTLIDPLFPAVDPTPIPNIGSLKLKKLRKTLFNNLVEDGILANKNILVEMKLFNNLTLVNDEPIAVELMPKYQNLTNEIGFGPERKIKMTTDFILAGDFTMTGFIGSGVGMFSDDILEENLELIQPIDLTALLEKETSLFERNFSFLERENNALHLYAREIQENTPNYSGRKRLFSPNLNGNKAKKLHADLQLLLQEDNFINEENDFAVIQLPKGIIRINGQELSGARLQKYQQLLNKEYRIKNGQNRMVLFSPHIIKAGNFKHGSFTGTMVMFPLED